MSLLEKVQAISPDVTEPELNKVLVQLNKVESQIGDSEVVALVKRIKSGRSSLANTKGFATVKGGTSIDPAPEPEARKTIELPQADDSELEALRKAIESHRTKLERLQLQARLLELKEETLQAEQSVAASEAQIRVREKVAPELIQLAVESGEALATDFGDRTKAALKGTLAVGKETPLDAEIGLAQAAQRKASQLNRLRAITNGTPELLPEMRLPQGQTIDV